jgi:TRAP-type C4-dicarboxylate transport system substrate-binding protein
MKNGVFFLLTIVCLFFSCTKQDDFNGVEIRVYNSTPVQVESINISGADRQIAFASLNAGFTTGYKTAGPSNLTNISCNIFIKGQTDPYHISTDELTLLVNAKYTCQIKYANAAIAVDFIKE